MLLDPRRANPELNPAIRPGPEILVRPSAFPPWSGTLRPSVSTLKIHDETLDNGLRLLLRESHVSPVANLQIWAQVGSADEGPGEEGLAHFHEHMLFKGTERRGVGEIAGDVEGAGGRINAYTSFDVTVYYATLPAAALGTGVDVLSDAVLHSRFDADEVAREQEVVIEEIRRSEDTPGHVLGDLTFREAYHEHPYRAPILGTPESVSGLSRDRCLNFFRRWYAPDNLTVIAAGDFDTETLRDQIAELFASATPGQAQRQRPIEPRHTHLKTAVLRRPFEGHRFELAWPSAAFRETDATYLDLLSFLLGECDSSRLAQRVREQTGLVDKIDSSSYTPVDRGLFSINFETDPARAPRALEAIAEEVERLRSEPVSDEELERARANFLATEHFERESVSGMASKIGSFELMGGGWETEEDYFAHLRTATPDDLLRVAQEYLSLDQLTACALIPEASGDEIDEARLAEALQAGHARVPRGQAKRREPSAPKPTESLPLRTEPVDERGPGEIYPYSLPGGGKLYVAPRRSVPVVAGRAAFFGGLLAETESNSGLGSFTASMWSRGTERQSAVEFARAVEDLAADVSGFSGRSSVGLTFESTSDQLIPVLELAAEVLTTPRFEAEEIERERRETLAAIDRRADQLSQRAFQIFVETEFPKHPYRRSMLGERESVIRFDEPAIRAQHHHLIRSSNLHLAIAGDVDPDETAHAVIDRLRHLPDAPFERPVAPTDPLPTEIQEKVLEKDRAQAHLVLGFRGTTISDPDRHGLEVLSHVLSGQGGRLFLDLRDRQSLAYSVSAMNVEGLDPGFFAVYIGTAPDKVDVARAGILDHLQRLVDEAPSEDELDRARRNLIGNFAINQQRSAARAGHIALDTLYGLGPASHRDYPDQIAAITREDVLRIARQFFRLDAYTIALVRP